MGEFGEGIPTPLMAFFEPRTGQRQSDVNKSNIKSQWELKFHFKWAKKRELIAVNVVFDCRGLGDVCLLWWKDGSIEVI